MRDVLVSVLMPNYNNGKYLQEAIDSILNQTYKNIELIIIDDCSIDNSWQIIQRNAKKDKRVKIFRNKKNSGRPITRNKLLESISEDSKYFMWMDSDDVVDKNIIEDKVNFLEKHKKIDGVGSAIEYVDENLKFIKKREYPNNFSQIKKIFLLYSPYSQGGLMLRSELKKYKYDLRYKLCQDYDMWARLITDNYKIINLKKCYYKYRQFANQGKQKKLKLTIWNTIRIKSKYIFKLKNFSFKALFRYFVEIGFLFVPKKIILMMFYKVK